MANFLKNLHPLLRRDRNKKDNQDPNFALIEALNEEMNQVEKDAIESKLQSSLKTATSEYLDKFGDWFGVYRRTNEDDTAYRARIIKYLLLKRGTNNAIIEAIKDYLGREDIDVSVYEPFTNIFYTNKSHLNGEDHLMGYYYRFAVINVSIGDYFPIEIVDVINEFKPAGVTLYVTYDGASTIRGGAIIKWLEGLPKIETYQEFDRFIGYDDTFYGHINMNQSKDNDNSSSDIFKTNHSLISSLDVLTGSSSVGREYINYGYVTSYAYNPSMTSSVNQISASTKSRGQEVPTDYYMYTNVKNNNTVELNIQTTSGVSYLYNNFNFRDYLSKNRPQVDIQSDEARRIVSDYVKELSIDYYLSAVIPPDDSIEIKLQVYDFSTNKWLTVSINNLSFYEKNIGSNIGYIKDYLNSELNMFTRLEINAGRKGSVDIKVNYLDLMFYYYEKGIYTIKPYKALVENYLEMSRETQVEAFKISSLNNGDIITKSGYQPIGYLRLTDGYDNSINRNLLLDSENREADRGGSNSMRVIYTTSESLIPGEYYTITYELNTKNLDHTTILLTEDMGKRITVDLDETIRNKFTFIADENTSEISIFTGLAYTEENYTGKITRAKLEKGQTATLYQPNPEDIYGANDPNQNINLKVKDTDSKIINSKDVPLYTKEPEDDVQFLDKIVTLGNINTKVQSIGITNNFVIPLSSLRYSYYGNDWVTLKDFEQIPQGETITTNNLIDLYGLQTVDYSNINPMSKVSLRSIWNVKLGELNNKEGSLSNMPNDYFNAVWQDIDKLTDINLGSMRIVKDTEGGVFDGATGEIINATLFNVGVYTDLDTLAYTLPTYTEPLTLGSSRLISELREELLTADSLNVDNRIKVVDSISEQLPNNNILSNSYQTQTITQTKFAKYDLKEPIEQRKRYNLRIHGDFKEGLERLAIGNSNGSFNEVFVYPEDIKDGIVDITYTSRDDNYAEGKQRLNNDYRVYAQPYNSGVVTIYSLELIKV
ncbi:tail morphogenetic protein [Staphylococcus phage vB_SsapH-Golestan-105-M]|nr:tail morphogenetic protein [Staphylococcus phage vB_SsapH-Golestan-105-M]